MGNPPVSISLAAPQGQFLGEDYSDYGPKLSEVGFGGTINEQGGFISLVDIGLSRGGMAGNRHASLNPVTIPEPSTVLLFVTMIGGWLAFARWFVKPKVYN